METRNTATAWAVVGLEFLGLLLLSSMLACEQPQRGVREALAQRILAPQTVDAHRPPPATTTTVQDASGARPSRPQHTVASKDDTSERTDLEALASKNAAASQPARTLTLPQAIETAFQQQPRLRVYLENLDQAQRNREIAFAPYLPIVAGGYSVGWSDLRARLHDVTTTPQIGPVQLTLPLDSIKVDYEHSVFQMADLNVQWLICDFGRRLGRYRQAGLAVEIAGLQTERAYQTVADEVSVAYYEVLRRRALRKTAHDAVRRTEDSLDVARKLEKGGVVEKEKRLRAEVQLAENQRLLDGAEGAEAVAIAGLNLAIGLNANTPIDVQESSEIPPFTRSLAECLQEAVGQRREFRIAQQSIRVADEGRRVAKADFAPTVYAAGALGDLQQHDPRVSGDLLMGSINLQWTLYEGGKRVAELRSADSKIREAIAQARSIADTIAFQVTAAYQLVITARAGIEHSRPAVAQADENYRLVQARAKVGDATSADITDAESTLTRAQQEYLNSIHDYLIALVSLEYAMGVTPARGGPRAAGGTEQGGTGEVPMSNRGN